MRVAGRYFVTALQTIVSRRIDPFDTASVTIGSFDGVGSYNAIKQAVTLKGDVRVMKESTRKVIREQIETLVHGVEVMFGVQAELDYDDNYPVLVNDLAIMTPAVDSIQRGGVAKVFDCGPQDPSEDFAYFAQSLPAAFLYIGCAKDDGLDHPPSQSRLFHG